MKAASATLISLLAGNQTFLMADLFSFTLSNGNTLAYTTADGNITYNSVAYVGVGPLVSRGTTRIRRGVEVDTLSVEIYNSPTLTIEGQQASAFATAGGFDGARLELDRLFMTTFGDTSAGTLSMFSGRVAQVEASRTAVSLTVNSDTELLNVQLPRNLDQAGCIHTLYDGGCGVTRASAAQNGTILAGSTAAVVLTTNNAATGQFDLGSVTFITSATMNGVSRSVKSYTLSGGNGTFTLSAPLPAAPTPGDIWTAQAGCDKTLTLCTSRFANQANFRGEPFIPVAEATT